MGKNKRRQFEYIDQQHNISENLDSQEEVDFFNFIVEAIDLGIISKYEYQPESLLLSESSKIKNIDGKEKVLFREHIYTPDFKISFNPSIYRNLASEFKISFENKDDSTVDAFIDVKGSFARNDGGRSFSINQKWVWQKYRIYVYKLVPKDFFKKFGVPEKSRLTDKKKQPRKIFIGYPSIKEAFQF